MLSLDATKRTVSRDRADEEITVLTRATEDGLSLDSDKETVSTPRVGSLNVKEVREWAESMTAEPLFGVCQNACTRTAFAELSVNRNRSIEMNHLFSHPIHPDGGKATDQKSTGRCWIFAGLNQARVSMNRKYNVNDFEFSQSFVFFWDRFEKSNFFLENVLRSLDEPEDGRLVAFLNEEPVSDGGQYDMLQNLIRKYGLVPKSVYPECEVTTKGAPFRRFLCSKLREFGLLLRKMHHGGATLEELRAVKVNQMKDVYRLLCLMFGTPPTKFDWTFVSKDRSFCQYANLSPLRFVKELVGAGEHGFCFDKQVCLINSPTEDKPFDRLISIDYLGNVVEGSPVRYINVSIDEMKKYALTSLLNNVPVWFGCDVGRFFHRSQAFLDTELFDFEPFLGVGLNLSKGDALRCGDSKMSHAMLFVGVDLDSQGKPRKWKVENSWGDDQPNKGFLAMSDEWFTRYVYEISVSIDTLSPLHREVLNQDPLVFPPWDPMGALA